MCGIAGIFNYRRPDEPVDRRVLERMTRALAHRGPDGEGFHVDGPLGLGHRRLAIVDLSPTGAQPMSNEDGSCWITYNGEFYDHASYRREVEGHHAFRGRSDTEALLHLLEERGPQGLSRISAILAAGFWEAKARRLTLVRDALGVKQVYFHDDGERVVFASEIKALLEAPDVPREVDEEAVNQYLHFHAPLFDRTFFRGIRQVEAGAWCSWTQDGQRGGGTFWSLSDFRPLLQNEDERAEELNGLLGRVVSDQLMSDVPVGAFFSGGIDSSAVASYATRAGRPPRCFGLHFAGQGVVDERPFQEAAARALGLELELMTLDGSTFTDDLPRLLRQQDQPVIGAAMLPMFHVSRLAARSVKVCLGGQAADEVFGGYARYSLAHPLRTALSLLHRRRRSGLAGRASPATSAAVGGNLRRQLFEVATLRRLLSNLGKTLDWRALYFANFAKVPEEAWQELLEARELVSRENAWLTFKEAVDRSPAADPAAKAMHWDAQAYLPGLFQQDDRMSMAVSLESRVPFADPRLVEFAFRLPFEDKIRDGASKWLLRQAVSDVLPEQVLNRRKVGFDTPISQWMSGLHAGFVRETLLSTRARQRGWWSPAAMERWLNRTDHPLWTDVTWKVLCVELWAQSLLDFHP